jgi:hypothetical protein
VFQNALVADPRKNNTSHTRLQTRLRIKSNTFQLRDQCDVCNEDSADDQDDDDDDDEDEETKKTKKHCHCSLFQPSPDLLASLTDGQPNRRCREAEEKKRNKKEEELFIGELNYREMGGKAKEKQDLKNEVKKMKIMQKVRKEKEAKNAEKEEREKLAKKKQTKEVSGDALVKLNISPLLFIGTCIVRPRQRSGSREGGQEESSCQEEAGAGVGESS